MILKLVQYVQCYSVAYLIKCFSIISSYMNKYVTISKLNDMMKVSLILYLPSIMRGHVYQSFVYIRLN